MWTRKELKLSPQVSDVGAWSVPSECFVQADQGKRRNKAAIYAAACKGTLLSQHETIGQRHGRHRWIVLLKDPHRIVAFAENNTDRVLALFFHFEK